MHVVGTERWYEMKRSCPTAYTIRVGRSERTVRIARSDHYLPAEKAAAQSRLDRCQSKQAATGKSEILYAVMAFSAMTPQNGLSSTAHHPAALKNKRLESRTSDSRRLRKVMWLKADSGYAACCIQRRLR